MQSSDSESRIKPATLSEKLRSVARKIHHPERQQRERKQSIPEYQITHQPDGPRLRADQCEIPSNDELRTLLQSWKGMDPQDIMNGHGRTARKSNGKEKETRRSNVSQMGAPGRQFKDIPREERWEGPRKAPRPESDRFQHAVHDAPRRGSGASSLRPARPAMPASPLLPLRPESQSPLPPLPSPPHSGDRTTYWPGPESPPMEDLKSTSPVDIYRRPGPEPRRSNSTFSLDARIGDLSEFADDDIVSENGCTIFFKPEEPEPEFGHKTERCRMPGCNSIVPGKDGICTGCRASFAPRMSVFDMQHEIREIERKADVPPLPPGAREHVAYHMSITSPTEPPRKISVGNSRMAAAAVSMSDDSTAETEKIRKDSLISKWQSDDPPDILVNQPGHELIIDFGEDKSKKVHLIDPEAEKAATLKSLGRRPASNSSITSGRASPSVYGDGGVLDYYFDEENFAAKESAIRPMRKAAGRLLKARGERSVREQREREVPKSLVLRRMREVQGDDGEYTDEEVVSPLLSGVPARLRSGHVR